MPAQEQVASEEKDMASPPSESIVVSKAPLPAELKDDDVPVPEIPKGGTKGKVFMQPEQRKDNTHVFAYLTQTRGIDNNIVRYMLDKKLIYEDTRYNCVFPGYDKKGTMRYAALKGSNSERPFTSEAVGSKKLFGWAFIPKKESNVIRVFEGAIDALSFMTLEKQRGCKWNNAHYFALGGVSGAGLFQYLKDHKEIRHVELCLDSDPPGQENAKKIADTLHRSKGIDSAEIRAPESKDFNEDLKKKRIPEEAMCR
jgi:hypothetical protein